MLKHQLSNIKDYFIGKLINKTREHKTTIAELFVAPV